MSDKENILDLFSRKRIYPILLFCYHFSLEDLYSLTADEMWDYYIFAIENLIPLMAGGEMAMCKEVGKGITGETESKGSTSLVNNKHSSPDEITALRETVLSMEAEGKKTEYFAVMKESRKRSKEQSLAKKAEKAENK